MEAAKSEVGGGSTPFVAPERVLTGTLPFGKLGLSGEVWKPLKDCW